ncbi:uncharacterized protein LOC113851946 [Abrus precatorius]|uniref:Uncharacterized protein LOC113851946 n=1 Tax=Abrus precatorius TaxID=3816 RepID=A0A8B8K2Y6_ABRPR|nr:uncharacterized protein LOC113851946 [Abrus precatorius]
MPEKSKDPGTFTIPCIIGYNRIDNAMLDLGASITVMPLSIFTSLSLGSLQPIGMVIKLANRSITNPAGIVEDVLVRVNNLIFLADFYILDMQEGESMKSTAPIILERPFLKTARMKIDVSYKRFIKDFSKIVIPLSKLLQKEAEFNFDEKCKESFNILKKALTTTPIIQPPDWRRLFELMCDASNFTVGVILAQQVGKLPHVIYYASRILDLAQCNYTTTEKELLVIVFALDKFRSYLLRSKVVIFTDHSILKYLLKKTNSKLRLISYRRPSWTLEDSKKSARCRTVSRPPGKHIPHVKDAKKQEEQSLGDMRCLNNPYYIVTSLMSRVLISWDPSYHFLVFYIYCLLLIMSQNGWKSRLPGLMMPGLL